MDAGEQADEIVLPAQREHRVDQVMADASLALLDLETVGEEVSNFSDAKESSLPGIRNHSMRMLSNVSSFFLLCCGPFEITCVDLGVSQMLRHISEPRRQNWLCRLPDCLG